MRSKHLAKSLGIFAAVFAVAAMFAAAAQAKTPAPGYEQFAGCPSKEEVPTIATCITTTIVGGHFHMGNKEVPIENPMTLSGGLVSGGTQLVFNSKGGLTPVKQKVPGGVIGLTGLTWLFEFLGSEALTLYAVTELAGTPGSPLANPVTLPIKVHLINGVLGNNCYVGSNSSPINLALTFGTTSPPPPNEPISGKSPTLKNDSVTHILHLKEGVLVDNSFAAPGANGCVLTLFGFIPISINGLVNSASGLPAAAGTNETVQEVEGETVANKFVYP